MQHKLRSLIKKRKETTKKSKIFLVGSISFLTITLLIIIAITVIFGIWLQDKINSIKDNVVPAEELFAKMPRGGAKYTTEMDFCYTNLLTNMKDYVDLLN